MTTDQRTPEVPKWPSSLIRTLRDHRRLGCQIREPNAGVILDLERNGRS
jgi:hypothetical protein